MNMNFILKSAGRVHTLDSSGTHLTICVVALVCVHAEEASSSSFFFSAFFSSVSGRAREQQELVSFAAVELLSSAVAPSQS